jgi:hypothetical protein
MIKSTVQAAVGIAGLVLGASLCGQVTETPDTVQPGRFLLEMDALSLRIDRDAGDKYTAFGAASTFLTTGLTANWDLQVGAEFFLSQKFDTGGLGDRRSGIGDVYVRTKWRFFESAEYYASMALLPYVKLPTNSGGVGNDSVEGGLIVPFQAKVLGDCDFAAMAEVSMLRNDNDDGYDSHWFASAALTRQVFKVIGLYAEATAGKSSGGAPWAGTLGAGATLSVTKNMWWDYSISRGLSRGAPDWTHVLRFNYGF